MEGLINLFNRSSPFAYLHYCSIRRYWLQHCSWNTTKAAGHDGLSLFRHVPLLWQYHRSHSSDLVVAKFNSWMGYLNARNRSLIIPIHRRAEICKLSNNLELTGREQKLGYIVAGNLWLHISSTAGRRLLKAQGGPRNVIDRKTDPVIDPVSTKSPHLFRPLETFSEGRPTGNSRKQCQKKKTNTLT